MAEGAWEDGEEGRAGVWKGRRGRAEEIRRQAAGGWFAGTACGGALGRSLAHCRTCVELELRSGRQAANAPQRAG